MLKLTFRGVGYCAKFASFATDLAGEKILKIGYECMKVRARGLRF